MDRAGQFEFLIVEEPADLSAEAVDRDRCEVVAGDHAAVLESVGRAAEYFG